MATLISIKPLTLMLAGEDEDGNADATQRMYLVELDGKPADFAEVLSLASTVPIVGDNDAAGRICTKRNVARFPGAALTHYIVTCDFEQVSNEFTVSPLSRKDDISFDIDSETETFFKDFSDTPKRVLNTNGERFDALPERTTGGVKLVVEGNRSTFNAAQAVDYTRPSATNTAAFTVRGIPIGTGQAKMTSISGKPTTEDGFTFWRVKWEMALAPDWNLKIENMGFTEVDDEGVPWPILRGTPPEAITSPWPLNEDGTPKPNQNDEPFVIEFKPYPSKSFSVFNWTAAF